MEGILVVIIGALFYMAYKMTKSRMEKTGKSFWQVMSEDISKQAELKQAEINAPVRCPKCKSTQITSNQKGFSTGKAVVGTIVGGIPGTIIGGKMGSKKVIITCLKCGKQWTP